jgi:NAD(P)H-flavin reductase
MSTAAETLTTAVQPVPDAMRPEPYRIMRVRHETHDTFTIELRPEGGGRRPPFLPGQFNMLYVFGVGEIPISISGDPGQPDVLVHTTRAVGQVTNAMSALEAGDLVGVRGPFGVPWPVDVARGHDVVIVAGGIGLAPLRSALYALLHDRTAYGNVVLLYGTRSPKDILYRKELERWRARFDLEVHVTVDRSLPSWHGNVGVVTTLIHKAPFTPRQAVAMICGPEVMIRFTCHELQRRGVPTSSIYVSMERNMKCAIGLCGHCQIGQVFVCKDGPVFPYDRIQDLVNRWEV